MQSSEPAEVKFMFKNYLLHGVNCFRNINAEVTFFSYSEFIYDLQSHETILTERLDGKDEIAFSYTQKNNQKQTTKMCHKSQSSLSASSKNGSWEKKKCRYNLQGNYPQTTKNEKIRRGKISALAELLK